MNTRANLDSACLDSCMVGQALDGMCVGLIMMNATSRIDWILYSDRFKPLSAAIDLNAF